MTEVQLKQIKKVDIYPKLRDRRTDIFYFMEYSTNIFTRFVLEFEFYVLREHLARQNEGYSNGWSRRGEWERQWKKERERERWKEGLKNQVAYSWSVSLWLWEGIITTRKTVLPKSRSFCDFKVYQWQWAIRRIAGRKGGNSKLAAYEHVLYKVQVCCKADRAAKPFDRPREQANQRVFQFNVLFYFIGRKESFAPLSESPEES